MFLLFHLFEVLHPLILDMFVDMCVLLGSFLRSFCEDRGPSYKVLTKFERNFDEASTNSFDEILTKF